MKKPKAAVSWSGGKDSYLALHRAASTFDIRALLTMLTEDGTRSRSHGLRPEVLARQASLLNLSLVSSCASWNTYEGQFKSVLRELAEDEFSHVVFGDIFPDEHKMWVERVCSECGLAAVEPLWGEETASLLQEFLATGAQAQIVATNGALLDDKWLGRQLSKEMLPTFASLGIDACGERGEYHTLVFASPLMGSPLQVREVARVLHDGYWLLDLELL
jgi:uncharacterized protein (TIGR00290 family)